MITKINTSELAAETLTEAEQRRINHGFTLQALRETVHAANVEATFTPARFAEIEALAADETAKDPVQLQALREMVAFLNGKLDLGEARGERIHDLANSDGPIESILCNDENSSDEELVDHLMMAFEMRRIEAVEHVKRRDYLQRYLPSVRSRAKRTGRTI